MRQSKAIEQLRCAHNESEIGQTFDEGEDTVQELFRQRLQRDRHAASSRVESEKDCTAEKCKDQERLPFTIASVSAAAGT